MENEKIEIKPCHQGKTLSIIAIVLSIISIVFSAFTLGLTLSRGKDREMRNEDCRMQMECPMRNMQDNQTNTYPWETFRPQYDRPAFESSGPSMKGQSKNTNKQKNNKKQGSNNSTSNESNIKPPEDNQNNNGFDFRNFE